MLIIKPKININLNFNDYQFNFNQNDEYLIAQDVFNIMNPSDQQIFTVKPEESYQFKFYNGEPLNGKTLLVIGQLAYGDAICMTPALREIKKKYPDMKLWVTVSGRALLCFDGLPYIDRIFPMPISMGEVKKAHYIVKCVEMVNTEEFDLQNMVDYYLHKFRLYDITDTKPDFPFQENEQVKQFLHDVKMKNRKKLLLYHPLASSINRTLNFTKLKEILSDQYIPVIALPPEMNDEVVISMQALGITEFANLTPSMQNIKILAEVIKNVDVVVTVDTVVNHIASCIEKPTVLISCSINPSYRSSTYSNVIPVTNPYSGKACIAPCNKHALQSPCFESKLEDRYFPPCMTEINPKVIKQAIEDVQLIKTYKDLKDTCYCGSKNTKFYEVINGTSWYHCHDCGLYFTKASKNALLHENTPVGLPNRFIEAFEKTGIKVLTGLENHLLEGFTKPESELTVFITPNYESLYFQSRPLMKYVWWDSRFYMPNAKVRFTKESLYNFLSRHFKFVKIVAVPLTYDFLLQSIIPYGVAMQNFALPPDIIANVLTLTLRQLVSNSNNLGDYLLGFCSDNPINIDINKLLRFVAVKLNFERVPSSK